MYYRKTFYINYLLKKTNQKLLYILKAYDIILPNK